MTIYNRIKMLREFHGWTQQELAAKTGYSHRTSITKIEEGLVDISLTKVEEFAKAFGVTPMYLMGWEDMPEDDLDNEIQQMYDSLSDDKKEQAKAFLRFLTSQDTIDK